MRRRAVGAGAPLEPPQNTTFNANGTLRGVFDCPVMIPKLAPLIVVPGAEKTGVFVRLQCLCPELDLKPLLNVEVFALAARKGINYVDIPSQRALD